MLLREEKETMGKHIRLDYPETDPSLDYIMHNPTQRRKIGT